MSRVKGRTLAILMAAVLAVIAALTVVPMTAQAETYDIGVSGRTKADFPDVGNDYFSEYILTLNGRPVYCLNQEQGVPNQGYSINFSGYTLWGTDEGSDSTTIFSEAANYETLGRTKITPPSTEINAKIRRVLYFGYDNDAAGILDQIKELAAAGQGTWSNYKDASEDKLKDLFYLATQFAVWHFTDDGSDGSGNTDAISLVEQMILAKVNDTSIAGPTSAFVNQVLEYKRGSFDMEQNIVVPGNEKQAPAPEPKITNTTAKGNDAAGSVTVQNNGTLKITDVVELSDLSDGVEYELVSELYSGQDGVIQTKTKSFSGKDATTHTVTFDDITCDTAGEFTYNIKTTLKGGTEPVTHNGSLEDTNERITVTVEEPTPEVKEPTVGTQAKAASGNSLKPAKNQGITDTVTLTNLVEGVEYTITGKLMVKEDNKEVTTYKVEPTKFTATAAEAAAESVTKTVTFTGIDATDLGGKSLVVFETLSWAKVDAHGDKTSVGHANINDAKQTVSVDKPETPTKTYEISISKQSINGTDELPGAELTITDASGKTVEEWPSGTEARKVQLAPGTYTLTEITAPEGYEIAEKITFTVDANGKVDNGNSVTMKDALVKHKVTISKKAVNGTDELEGAELTVTGTDFEGNAIETITWTSGKVAKIIELPAGTYTLTEKQAPALYDIAESIGFTVKADGTVESAAADGTTITMEDKLLPVEPVAVSFKATKVLNGASLEDDMFSFAVSLDMDKTTLQPREDGATYAIDLSNFTRVASNKADGSITFDPIWLAAAGEYVFNVEENGGIASTDSGGTLTCDESIKTITVSVKEDNGKLIASVAGNNPTFTNTFTPDSTPPTPTAIGIRPKVTKNLTGPEGLKLKNGEFSFVLFEVLGDPNGGEDTKLETLQTKTNDATGAVAFDILSYSEPGAHTYYIAESTKGIEQAEDGKFYKGGVLYDGHMCTLTVVVTLTEQNGLQCTTTYSDGADGAVFNNEYDRTFLFDGEEDSHPEAGTKDNPDNTDGNKDGNIDDDNKDTKVNPTTPTNNTTPKASTSTTTTKAASTTAKTGDDARTLAAVLAVLAVAGIGVAVAARRRAHK